MADSRLFSFFSDKLQLNGAIIAFLFGKEKMEKGEEGLPIWEGS